MDTIKPVERNWKLGLLADAIQGVYDFGSKPFGYDNPPVKGLLDLATVPSIAKTIDRLSWGDNLTTGKGQTTRILPETADALLAAVPAMNVAERLTTKGANYVARNAGPYLDRTVGGFIEGQIAKNGAPSRYLQDMARGSQSPLTVWHGSPHKFDKFDSSKIGTGEGAQAYGHGLYLAEEPSVAKGYQQATSKDRFITSDGYFDPSILEHLNVRAATRKGDLEDAISTARKYAEPDPDYPEIAAKAARDLAKLEQLKASGGMQVNTGSLYKVDLPDEAIAKMLDWDKPLSQQHPDVQNALKMLDPETWHPSSGDYDANELGQSIYQRLTNQSRDAAITAGRNAQTTLGASQAQAAEDLRAFGIPGIRYLDGGSRGTGAGSSNFVVFPGNEDILKILERNGQGLLAP